MPTYSKHARQQMARRGITEADVEWALRRENRREAGEPGTIWIHGMASGRQELKVCVRANDNDYVITAAWPDL